MVNYYEIADTKIISQEFLKAARPLRSLHLGAFKLRGPSFPAVAASRTSPDLIPRTLSLCQVSSRRPTPGTRPRQDGNTLTKLQSHVLLFMTSDRLEPGIINMVSSSFRSQNCLDGVDRRADT